MECSHKYKELTEESGKWRDTCQGKKSKCHDHSQFGIGFIKPVIIFTIHFTVGMLFDGVNHTEDSKIGSNIYHYIIYQRCHALRSSCQHGQHNVTGL